jgi:DNA-binding SARP family transcriptional activator
LFLMAGRLDAAMTAIDAAIEASQRQGVSSCEESARQTKGLILAAAGRVCDAIPYLEELYASATRANRTFEAQAALLDYSMLLRASGEPALALEKAESACALLEPLEWRLFRCQAHTERLASRLALGDEELVYREGLELRKEFEDTGYSFYLLRLDMVLAEIERRRGLVDQAASRIAEHAEHIRGEGSNWHMAMYTRAFPGLLGVFARALGPDGIPVHMLRMLLEPWASRSLEMARPVLDDAGWRRLVLRTLGKASGAAFLAAHEGPPVLKVRLFGGLSVEGPHGTVGDKAWGKRKARLLFAMLAMHRGRDLPRDVIFERLWPDMPADKAQSNFYVTWSYMKKALSPDGGPCPYLEHRGGVCRVVPEAVTTDLAEFFEAAEELRRARARGDQDTVVAAAERMAELHAGELLAGDLYEDWCAEMRERARHELSDAMLAGAEALAASGAPDRAVRLVRHALAFDPWREDLYLAALRYQIGAGQRSSAIDTYMACRQMLA